MPNFTLFLDRRIYTLLWGTSKSTGRTMADLMRQGVVAAIESNAGLTNYTPQTEVYVPPPSELLKKVQEIAQALGAKNPHLTSEKEELLVHVNKCAALIAKHREDFLAAENAGVIPRKTYMKLKASMTTKARHLSDRINATPA